METSAQFTIAQRRLEMVSECCGAPPLTNTDVHDGIAMCNACKEWSAFYDEDEAIHYNDPGDENDSFK